jgi:transcriptional regulator with GAF, ATPase, and Fis domain
MMGDMTAHPDPSAYAEEFRHLSEVRAQALEHHRLAQQFHAERRDLIGALIKKGFSQADSARELGVTRQAIQKMMSP